MEGEIGLELIYTTYCLTINFHSIGCVVGVDSSNGIIAVHNECEGIHFFVAAEAGGIFAMDF